MRRGGLEHLQMDVRTFLACETDIADSSRFLGLERSFHRPAGGEDAVRIGRANDFVKLQEVDMIGLEPAKRFFDLVGGSFLVATVDFRHEECSPAIAVAECLAHTDLALPIVIVPAVIEKVESIVDCGAHDANTLRLFDVRPGEVVSAQAYHRNHLSCVAEPALGELSFDVPRVYVGRYAGQHRSAGRDFQESSSFYC